jgi:hypothetical protein
MPLLLALLACASGNSCADYIAAMQECATESGDSTVYDADTICGDWTAEQEELYGDWYQCQASAYTAQECKTATELNDAENAAATCPQPTAG